MPSLRNDMRLVLGAKGSDTVATASYQSVDYFSLAEYIKRHL